MLTKDILCLFDLIDKLPVSIRVTAIIVCHKLNSTCQQRIHVTGKCSLLDIQPTKSQTITPDPPTALNITQLFQ